MTRTEPAALITRPIPASSADRTERRPDLDRWLTDLSIDQTDPFFFDHPLDHVPGIMLICATADQARNRGGVPENGRVKGMVTFRAMSDGFSPRPVLQGEVAETGRRAVRITQGATVLADGWFEVSPGSEPEVAAPRSPRGPAPSAPPDLIGADSREPAWAVLVHRTRPENIILGDPVVTGSQVTASVLLPPAGHALCGSRAGRRSVRGVIEAGRQLSVWLTHRLGGWPLDAPILWLKLTADLPFGLPSTVPVALRWKRTDVSGTRALVRFDVIADDGNGADRGGTYGARTDGTSGDRTDGGRKVGSVTYLSMRVHPEQSAAPLRTSKSAV